MALLNTCGMQESERSRKKLTPVMELKLEQGLYKGRCLAGLPDGKVRKSLIPSSSFVFGNICQGYYKICSSKFDLICLHRKYGGNL